MDYDAVAGSYDRRYAYNDYTGVERTLRDFARDSSAVLEVGCGTGHWLMILASQPGRLPTVVGLDDSSAMLARARAATPAVHLVRGRAEVLPFETACFDRVFCINALHHFHDKPAFVASARRVLRPGGGLLSVQLDPHTGRDRWWIYDFFPEALPADRARYPAGAVIRRWMKNAGFTSSRTTLAQRLTVRRSAKTALDQGAAERSATSQLAILSEDAYESGIRRLRSAMDFASAHGETLELTADLRLFATTCWAE